jgi:hypothetical protein
MRGILFAQIVREGSTLLVAELASLSYWEDEIGFRARGQYPLLPGSILILPMSIGVFRSAAGGHPVSARSARSPRAI